MEITKIHLYNISNIIIFLLLLYLFDIKISNILFIVFNIFQKTFFSKRFYNQGCKHCRIHFFSVLKKRWFFFEKYHAQIGFWTQTKPGYYTQTLYFCEEKHVWKQNNFRALLTLKNNLQGFIWGRDSSTKLRGQSIIHLHLLFPSHLHLYFPKIWKNRSVSVIFLNQIHLHLYFQKIWKKAS